MHWGKVMVRSLQKKMSSVDGVSVALSEIQSIAHLDQAYEKNH